MSTAYQDLRRIVSSGTAPELRTVAIRGFAEKLHWTPSYELQASFGVDAAHEHLAVEHGLEHSAVISFLRAPYRASDLTPAQLRALLSISYNNLVEWHLFVSETDVRRVNNLADIADGEADQLFTISPTLFDRLLSATEIEKLVGLERRRRSLRACDDAIMQVLSRWKRLLKSDYPGLSNVEISALFNAIIFVRGCEDQDLSLPHRTGKPILDQLSAHQGSVVDMKRLLAAAFSSTGVEGELSEFVNLQQLTAFTALDWSTAQNLCRDFYAPRDAPYDFNFTLMSKHALSRIYERYVTLLQPEQDTTASEQLSFIGPSIIEKAPVHTGAIYTPQFVAGFFCRFIRDNTTPRTFRSLRTLDPACGSGIFLRTMLELRCNPLAPGTTAQTIKGAFDATEGIDRDPNACEATRLSLALLHLAASGELPQQLKIRNAEAVSEALADRMPVRSYGAVLVNPPYIKHENIGPGDQTVYRSYLGSDFKGRLDAYLPIVQLSLNSVAEGGFACFVLPQVFLQAENASALRNLISDEFEVRCLADLSSVEVFEGVGTYNILLVVQRKLTSASSFAVAQVAQVTDFVGAALQACLDGRLVDTPYQKVFPVDQDFFRGKDWTVVSPQHLHAEARMRRLPTLADFVSVTQGIVTGLDSVFVMRRDRVPPSEQAIYLDLLPDREMQRYRVPSHTDQVMFYPFVGDMAITEVQLQEQFPVTYQYLQSRRGELERRRPVATGATMWWRPERPRDPSQMRVPKIVSPHLMLTPRFSFDGKGRYGVTRSAVLRANKPGEQSALLKFFTAVLNSSAGGWLIRSRAPKYGHGYSRVEPSLLKQLPVPDLRSVDSATLHRIITSVERMSASRVTADVDRELDVAVAELYGFSQQERSDLLGMS